MNTRFTYEVMEVAKVNGDMRVWNDGEVDAWLRGKWVRWMEKFSTDKMAVGHFPEKKDGRGWVRTDSTGVKRLRRMIIGNLKD